MKRFEFVSPAAKKAYLALPKKIQYQFGVDLNAVQQGKEPFSAHKVLTEGQACQGIRAQTEIEKSQAACAIDTSHVTLNGRRLVA